MGNRGLLHIRRSALVYQPSGWGSLQWPDYEDSFVHAVDYSVRRCLLGGEAPLSGLDQAITTMRIVELAQQSARQNAAVPFSPV